MHDRCSPWDAGLEARRSHRRRHLGERGSPRGPPMEARRNRPRRPFIILRLAAALLLSATVLMVAGHLGATSPQLSATTLNLAPSATTASVGDPVVAAAGDIACDPLNSNFNGGAGSSNSCHQKAVSDLLVNGDLSAVMLLGDNQYYCGSYSAFQQS